MSNFRYSIEGSTGGHDHHELAELSAGQIAAVCSSLAKGCEKQRLNSEMEAFYKIAAYYKSKAVAEKSQAPQTAAGFADAAVLLAQDLKTGFPNAGKTAKENADRGAQRSLVWSEKVSIMMEVLLERYAKEGDALLEKTRVFVCDICGFIYIGDTAPELCPVCKVQKFKLLEIERS